MGALNAHEIIIAIYRPRHGEGGAGPDRKPGRCETDTGDNDPAMISATVLKYKAPLDWNSLLGFLAPRAIRGVEHVDAAARRLRRSLVEGGEKGWVECVVREDAGEIAVRASGNLELAKIAAKAGQVFDLSAAVEELEKRFPGRAGVRVPGAWDAFEMGVRAILGQQVSVKAAHTLAGRLVERWGEAVETPWPEVGYSFPRPERLAEVGAAELRGIGLTARRAETLHGYAVWSARMEEERPPLRSLPGIGPWTEAYFRMRSGADRDAFPAGDLGVQKALGVEKPGSGKAEKEASRRADAWRPYRAYAVMLLWSGSWEAEPKEGV